MKQPEVCKLLQDILAAITQIEAYAAGVTRDEFETDPMRVDAVPRQFTVVGEAVNQLGSQFRIQHPHIPWNDILGMRHKVVHDYKGISLEIVWQTLTLDLPGFKQEIQDLLQSA
jgi:uncharacterized protein with HEPN domain